ncbi:MAG: magnesium-translocating P-type ATPase [Acholeplasmataceae bacterium]|nr:magnesium-translocating P-type ATPase [Acholeplasmataceae bacterium]MCK9289207.1 magnesium-translocating P-type ATPase [Acholeplasmataceae bacterium]MCK9427687.1 magnesium-translocating P-type ATPase [Acholeplasmataceae bacterium]
MNNEKKVSLKRVEHDLEIRLKSLAFLDEELLFKELASKNNGLTVEEAEDKLAFEGKNIIEGKRKKSTFKRLIEPIINPFNLLLIGIAVMTLFTDVIFADTPEYITIIIILSLVFLSSAIAFIQSERSNNAVEKLLKLVTNTVDVLRDDEWLELNIEEIVSGDIIKLSAGDMIPADVRFLTTKDTFVAQAALTGESNPVEKYPIVEFKQNYSLTDIENLGFMGSNIVSGSATAIVLATGNNTFYGSMAESLRGTRALKSFERGIGSVSKLLIQLTLLMIPLVLIINGVLKNEWWEALLFAISIAVGLTPEMLPVIMTSTLAKGAITMSKHQVVVKSLGTIQTFGEMDILCTDKTGTLTEDKIVLEKYMNLHGDDDKRVLRHAYLNSYFQTGLKNLIDIAVINRAHEDNLDKILTNYQKVDEIPFDFTRRRMSVVLQDKTGKRQLITKGAVEEMMEISAFIEIDGKVEVMNESLKELALKTYQKHNQEGLRILAVAQKNEVPDEHTFGVADESDLVLIGFIGFLDPPKESAKDALFQLKEHGIRTIVLTGDSEGVTRKVCQKLNIDTTKIFVGFEIDNMNDEELVVNLRKHDVYAKLTPAQKERIVKLLQQEGHTVGYLGDGINDAPALHQADIGISVDSAVDIAKETADIVLLEKDLLVLEEGVIEGRKTFGNIIKYIKMAASGNFGNMIAVIVASIFLPFLPMLPIHILTQNLLNDFSQLGMPFDKVDSSYLKKPRKWDTKGIRTFTFIMGPLSSIFDILTFLVLWYLIIKGDVNQAPLFHAGWFVFGTVSQIVVIYAIRTEKISFLQSLPAKLLIVSTVLITTLALLIGFTTIGSYISLAQLPLVYLAWLFGLALLYVVSVEIVKKLYIKRYNTWM